LGIVVMLRQMVGELVREPAVDGQEAV